MLGDNQVRDLHWSDIPALAVLEHELFGPDAWAEATWWAELAGRPRREYVVLERQGEGGIVGYAGLDHGGEVADVMTIATAPRAQGEGVGRLLLDLLLDRAERRGASAVLLEVRADNTRAVRLYERAGFAQISVRRRYYQPGDVDALIMRKLLKPKESHG